MSRFIFQQRVEDTNECMSGLLCRRVLRRIRLVEENKKRVAAKQQQQVQVAAMENKNESSLSTLDRSDRSGRMTPR